MDVIHVPSELVWIEWCEAPWERELSCYGFSVAAHNSRAAGRRGALVCSSPDGRRGLVRTFCSRGDSECVQDFAFGDQPISRVGDHLEGVTGGAVGDDS